MSHYYSEKQSSSLDLKEIEVVVAGKSYIFYTGSGVFSKNKLDFGTKVLVEHMKVGSNDKVLDLGCGIGIVGRVAAGVAKKVFLVDINERAVKLAKMNTKGLDVVVKQGNMYEPVEGEKFDVILLNPPQTAGKKVCFEMIEKAPEFLKSKGSLQLVARHNKGGETLSKHMVKVFGRWANALQERGL